MGTRPLPHPEWWGLRTAKRDQTVDQEAIDQLQQRFGLQEQMGVSLARPSSGHAEPDVLSGALSLSRNSEGKCNPGSTGRREYLPLRLPVLDTNRRPLMPTTPARARLLFKQGNPETLRGNPNAWAHPGNVGSARQIRVDVRGGTLKGKMSLHNAVTGGWVTQTAKVEDCMILTSIAWRTEWYAGIGRRHSSPA